MKNDEPPPGSAERLLRTPPETEPVIPTPPHHKGWYSRGYLPHCDYPGLLQSISYRLVDSLPSHVLSRIEEEIRTLPYESQQRERRRRLEHWLDAGFGSCALRNPKAAAIVIANWQHFACVRYDLISWVVMPNHVHVLIRQYEGQSLAGIIQSWKSYTGKAILRALGIRRLADGLEGLWMEDYWDRFIRDEMHFQNAIRYIHENPVKAGLVREAKEWPWTSAELS